MVEHDAVVGTYNSHTEAEAGIKELQRAGFDVESLSIVGPDKLFVIARGTAAEVDKAKSILERAGTAQLAVQPRIRSEIAVPERPREDSVSHQHPTTVGEAKEEWRNEGNPN